MKVEGILDNNNLHCKKIRKLRIVFTTWSIRPRVVTHF